MWKQSCPRRHPCPKLLFTAPSRLVTSPRGQLSLFSVAVVWPELVLKEALAQSIQRTISSLCLNKATSSCQLYIIYLLWSSATKLCLWRQEKQTKMKKKVLEQLKVIAHFFFHSGQLEEIFCGCYLALVPFIPSSCLPLTAPCSHTQWPFHIDLPFNQLTKPWF